jgi:hypothetical protein
VSKCSLPFYISVRRIYRGENGRIILNLGPIAIGWERVEWINSDQRNYTYYLLRKDSAPMSAQHLDVHFTGKV